VGRACSPNGEKKNAYRILVGKPKGKKPLVRHLHRCDNNIKMYLGEIEWDTMYCIIQAQDRDQIRGLVNTAMDLLVSIRLWRIPY
jgi:hypothetical protein